MKRFLIILILTALLLSGCAPSLEPANIAATTLPVYEFTQRLCEGTGITVSCLVTESVSCLHDYSLNVSQVKSAEAAEIIVISGAGLEAFMEDLLHDRAVIDASVNIPLLCPDGGESHSGHDHDHGHDHSHEEDPHIWLSPELAKIMANNICEGLCAQYPQFEPVFRENLQSLLADLDELQKYGEAQLADLSCREIITFHDGFSYFAQSFGLTIVESVEEESGSEASAKDLIHLIRLVREHQMPAIFTETNGSTSAARVIAAETGAKLFTLDMAMSGNGYFSSMYHNIDTIKEALQ